MIANVSGLDIVTLVIAVIGLLLGAASFGWQVLTWRHEGPLLRVSLSSAIPAYDAGLGEPHYCVTVTNVGRSSVALSGWGYELPDGQTVVAPVPEVMSTTLPHTLEGGQEAKFYSPYDSLKSAVWSVYPTGTTVTPFVTSALHGRVYGKRKLELKPDRQAK